jgi:phage-related baseplate assembly protein
VEEVFGEFVHGLIVAAVAKMKTPNSEAIISAVEMYLMGYTRIQIEAHFGRRINSDRIMTVLSETGLQRVPRHNASIPTTSGQSAD